MPFWWSILHSPPFKWASPLDSLDPIPTECETHLISMCFCSICPGAISMHFSDTISWDLVNDTNACRRQLHLNNSNWYDFYFSRNSFRKLFDERELFSLLATDKSHPHKCRTLTRTTSQTHNSHVFFIMLRHFRPLYSDFHIFIEFSYEIFFLIFF